MKPADARKRLFQHDRPLVRPVEVLRDDGQYGRDIGVLWAAYKKGSFPEIAEVELTQEVFVERLLAYLARFDLAWMVDDRNSRFQIGNGPVGLIVAEFDGWKLEPHWMPFSWATHRNRLRTIVGFLQFARYEKDLGIVLISAHTEYARAFRKVGDRYGVLHYIDKIPRGDYGHDQHLFYGRGGCYFKGKEPWAA